MSYANSLFKQLSRPPQSNIQRHHHHVHSQDPYPQFASTTTILTDDQIYQLAPTYFRLQPEILQTICDHHMSFSEFVVHHPVATTNILDHCDGPTIHSMVRSCTFIADSKSTTQSTHQYNSVISHSDSNSTGFKSHSVDSTTTYSSNYSTSNYSITTTNSHSQQQYVTDDKYTDNVSTYSNKHSENFNLPDQDQDDYRYLVY